MADTKNLPLNQPQKEVKKANPTSVLGGAMGWLDEIGEMVFRGQGDLVNEGPVTGQGLEQLSQPMTVEDLEQLRKIEHEAGAMPAEGSMTGFQTARTIENIPPKDSLYEVRLKLERIKVNSMVGIKNVLYEDTVRDIGSYRVDVEVDLERAKNSELREEDVRAKRQIIFNQATERQTSSKGALGPQNDLTKRTDVFDGQSRVVGANTGQ